MSRRPNSTRGPDRTREKTAAQLRRDVDAVMRAADALRDAPVIDRETWPDGTKVTWIESPFPFERKPIVPSSMIARRDARWSESSGFARRERTGTSSVRSIENADLRDLTGTQRKVTLQGVEKYLIAPSPDLLTIFLPIVLRSSRGKMYVADGHHRLTAAKFRGDQTARVRIVDIGRLDE